MRHARKIDDSQEGLGLVMVLVLLFIGSITIPVTLNLLNTGVKAEQMFEKRTRELYAANAGLEEVIHKIIYDDPNLLDLEYGDSLQDSMTEKVNDLTVEVETTRLYLMTGILGDDEYRLDNPHEEWVNTELGETYESSPGVITVSGTATFRYWGVGSRTVQGAGLYFHPDPGGTVTDATVTWISPLTSSELESYEVKTIPGSFAHIWRWEKSKGPVVDASDPDAGFHFEFDVENPSDPNWRPETAFVFGLVKEQDVSFIATSGIEQWSIEATAGETTIRAIVLDKDGQHPEILAWEVYPQL